VPIFFGSDVKNIPRRPPPGIGRHCFIRNAIIDKNACIGDGAYISPKANPRMPMPICISSAMASSASPRMP